MKLLLLWVELLCQTHQHACLIVKQRDHEFFDYYFTLKVFDKGLFNGCSVSDKMKGDAIITQQLSQPIKSTTLHLPANV